MAYLFDSGKLAAFHITCISNNKGKHEPLKNKGLAKIHARGFTAVTIPLALSLVEYICFLGILPLN